MEERDEFVNRTQGWVGATRINRKGEEESIPVAPGERVFLTEEEQVLTSRAHARPQDSPFVEREIVFFDPLTHEETDRFRAPLLEKVEPEDAEDAKPAARTAKRRKAATAVAA